MIMPWKQLLFIMVFVFVVLFSKNLIFGVSNQFITMLFAGLTAGAGAWISFLIWRKST